MSLATGNLITQCTPSSLSRFSRSCSLEDTLLLGIQRICFRVLGLIHNQFSLDSSYFSTLIPLQHLVSFGLNLVSRAFEFQADAFAKKLGYAAPLRAGLVKLQEENLSAMNTDPWYSAYHYSDPPLS
ncbi:hypothetical protein K7X08_036051 [Anisodus acutangulus]|uniref:Peptidase M48 domain-containing protein n=1 Tax=Anisodus acutangulus TaxID=402998 RepID=A0A9Q1L619_9SOLA|nr:hypothetical protein K7X08_036051 [Anisodus acutangulus]